MRYMNTPSLLCAAGRFLLSSVMLRTLRCSRLNSSEGKSESFAPQKGKQPDFTTLPGVCLFGPALILELTVFTPVPLCVQRLALSQPSGWSACIREQGRVRQDGPHTARSEMGPVEHACG